METRFGIPCPGNCPLQEQNKPVEHAHLPPQESLGPNRLTITDPEALATAKEILSVAAYDGQTAEAREMGQLESEFGHIAVSSLTMVGSGASHRS